MAGSSTLFLRPGSRGVLRRRPVSKPPQHVTALPPQLQLQPVAKGAGPAAWGRARLATACSGGACTAARIAAACVGVRRGTRSVAARRTAVPPTARAADAVAVR